MNALTTFQFEEHPVRSLLQGEQPWFVGKDVCDVLALKNSRHALARLAKDERDSVAIDDAIQRKRDTTIVNEPGVFRLIFTSRVPAAERFKRWLAHEVLPALRRTGRFQMPGCAPEESGGAQDELTPYLHRSLETHGQEYRLALTMVNEARRTWNKPAARRLWVQLGLPDVGGAMEAIAADAEARGHAALEHLLAWEMVDTTPVRSLLRDIPAQTAALADAGFKVIACEDCDYLAVGAVPEVEDIFDGTPWRDWRKLLAALPGARRSGALRFGKHNARGVLIPERYWR